MHNTNRFAAALAVATAVAALLAGLFFFFDPTHALATGSDAYWHALAEGHWGRTAFVAAFACTALFALGAVRPIVERVDVSRSAALHRIACLAYLGYAVSAISYLRLLGGESRRAAAYVAGDASTQAAIASFSLVLDPQGWLSFGAVGLFIASVNVAALASRAWPRGLALLGFGVALAYGCALIGLVIGNARWVALAAGVGAIGLGPLWWLGVAIVLWRSSPTAGR